MLREILISISVPLILISSPSLVFNKIKFYKKFDFLEKFIFNLAFSMMFITFSLVFFGYTFSSGIRILSIIFFALGFLFSIVVLKKILSKTFLILTEVKKSVLEGDVVLKTSLFLVFLFLIKILLFLIFKPIIDPDVVNYYLPNARSIFIADKIPERSYYDNSIMMFPPAGGSVFYAFFYNLTNNIFTESFRLLPIIFILGILICTYKIALKTVGKKLAPLALVIFLIFPFWDEYLFESLFYPDIIALFLFLSFFYFFIKENNFLDFKKEKLPYYLLTSLFLGATLFFKVQYFIAYYFLGTFFLISFLPKKWWGIFVLVVSSFPVLYRFQRGVGYHLDNLYLVYFFAFLVYLISVLISITKKKEKKINLVPLLIIFIGLSFGGLIHLRSYFLYGSFLSPLSEKALLLSYEITSKVGATAVSRKIQLSFLEWVIFVFPAFGIFWFLPKIVGIYEGLKKQKIRIILLFILVWYAIITLLFPEPNSRSLLPIFPFLAILIALGTDKIVNILKVDFYNFSKSLILISIIFSIFFSTFLWWNGGLLYFGGKDLRKVLSEKTGQARKEKRNELISDSLLLLRGKIPFRYREIVNKNAGKIINLTTSKLTDLSLTLTARGDFYQKRFKDLVLITLFLSIILVTGLYFLSKFTFNFKVFYCLIFTFYFLPTFLVFLLVSKEKIWEFKKVEAEELYNYWGQTKYVVPYLLKNADSKDKVVFWGIPTGLSYYTNLQSYNLLYGYHLGGVFKNIFSEKDLGKIYKFYKKNNFKYFVISSRLEMYDKYKNLKAATKMFDILEKQKYTKLEIKPNEENFWYVYKLK